MDASNFPDAGVISCYLVLMASFLDRALDWMVFPGYDATGYHIRKMSWDKSDTEVDLSGKEALITGANQGIGRATAEALLRRGARVHMVCRDPEKGSRALKELVTEDTSGKPELHIVDLSDVRALMDFLHSFQRQNRSLDILVNNAGVLLARRMEAPDGLEMTFAVNIRAPFLITETLFPLLNRSGDGRVINVSSGGMYLAPIQFQDLLWENRPFDGVMAYAETKRGENLLTQKWAEKWKNTGIKINSMHPGWADTQSVKDSLPLFRALTAPFLRSPEQGADTIVYLACKPDLSESGKFFCDREVRPIDRMKKTMLSPEQIDDYYSKVREISFDAIGNPV
ncbi:MAG: dehydrogenase [Spirochaetaceae bacterium]|nr:dehydrogenase [Spirochaetaceae bacterium]|tara:strand:+ start:33967 stop:34986 length:1020 start_codon:yes stop_codon:yes gene_type:complete